MLHAGLHADQGCLVTFSTTHGYDSVTHDCAQIFREMLRAEVEGRSYSPPPPSAVPPPQRGGGVSARSSPASTAAGSRNPSAAKNLDDWGNWDGDKRVRDATNVPIGYGRDAGVCKHT